MLLDDDVNSNFNMSNNDIYSDIYENNDIKDVIDDIDNYIVENNSAMHYSKQKQLTFDRIEVEYQKMMIVSYLFNTRLDIRTWN